MQRLGLQPLVAELLPSYRSLVDGGVVGQNTVGVLRKKSERGGAEIAAGMPDGINILGVMQPKRVTSGFAAKVLRAILNKLEEEALKIKNSVGDRQHIFNLGHGLLPETPIKNVHRFIEILRS